MRLHLRHVLSFDYYLGIPEALLYVGDLSERRPVDIARLWNIVRTAAAACGTGLIGSSGENQRCIRFTRLVEVHDKWNGLIPHLYERSSFFRSIGSPCCDSSNRLPRIAHYRV